MGDSIIIYEFLLNLFNKYILVGGYQKYFEERDIEFGKND